jgi:hypothetical protein
VVFGISHIASQPFKDSQKLTNELEDELLILPAFKIASFSTAGSNRGNEVNKEAT